MIELLNFPLKPVARRQLRLVQQRNLELVAKNKRSLLTRVSLLTSVHGVWRRSAAGLLHMLNLVFCQTSTDW